MMKYIKINSHVNRLKGASKFILKAGLTLLLLKTNITFAQSGKYIWFYDSTINPQRQHQLNLIDQRFDLSKTSKIEKRISSALRFKPNSKLSESEMMIEAKKVIMSSAKIQADIKLLERSYHYINAASKYGIDRIPALVLDLGDKHYVVYGVGQIDKAVEYINAYRVNER